MANDPLLRIGELSKRTGVSPELLRAWERRYGLLQPTRSAGGLRLYTSADLARVRRMQQQLADGLAAAEAAAAAMRDGAGERAAPPPLSSEALRAELADALDSFDEPRAQAVLDRLLAVITVDALLGEVVLPYLHELGERWARGEVSIAQEHFASALLRGRLLGLARGWGRGIGPTAVLACLPGEQHDLGLIAFGLALHGRGWRIVYLGPDTPIETVTEVSGHLQPSVIVLSAVTDDHATPVAEQLRVLATRHRLALAVGSVTGASKPDGVLVLTGDPIAEAARVSTLAPDDAGAPARGPMTGDVTL